MGHFSKTDYVFECPPNTFCSGRTSGHPNLARYLIDPPFVDQFALCGCQHVRAANGEHCLQSIERGGVAQGEGFAQFFASKVWNEPTNDSCTFVYYKELFDEVCHGRDPADCQPEVVGAVPGITTLPPFGINCREPFKWRNNHCPISEAAEMGTELDWIGFFYNLNRVGPLTSSMDDIWLIYRHACNPPPVGQAPSSNPADCNGQVMGWNERPAIPARGGPPCRLSSDCLEGERCRDATPGSDTQCSAAVADCQCKLPAMQGFRSGMQRLYGLKGVDENLAREVRILLLSTEFGVSEDLTP